MRRGVHELPISTAGFTLTELMVALALTGIIASQLFLVLKLQHQSYSSNERALDVQEDARLVVDLLSSDVRMAGFMVPERVAIASGDGGAAAPDRLCVSDPEAINSDPSFFDNRSEPFARAEVSSVSNDSGDLSSGHLDIDSDGNNDFKVQAGIIISDGAHSHCARITSITGNRLEFTPALASAGWILPEPRAAPAIIYEIDGPNCPLGLTRNCKLLSIEVEDLQVEFGVDDVLTDGIIDRTTAEFPVHDLNGGLHDPALIRSVRLTVVTRTPQDFEYTGPGYPGAANRAAGVSDGSRRRQFTSIILPRNLL